MNFKDLIATKEKMPDLMWSLVLEEGSVQAGLWYIKEKVAEVVSISPSSHWEKEEELVDACDATLSSATQKLTEDWEEPSKTVFGVPSFWVENGEIKEQFLGLIKKVCTELSLTPVGFVVLPEAIAHIYKSEEGAPVSAIILGLGKESLELTVFKLGTLVGTTQISRSVSLVDDVKEGLSRFEGATPLPSRFVVYDGKEGELEEARDALTAATWDETDKIKFLHTPKVEILEIDRKVLAVSLAGANEIGQVEHVTSNEPDAREVLNAEEVENISEPMDIKSATDLGFAIGQDVSQNPTPPPQPQFHHPQMPMPMSSHPTPPTMPIGKPLAKAKSMLHGLTGKMSFKPNFSMHFGKGKIFALLGLLAAGLISLFAAWWFLPRAKVSVYVTPKKFDTGTEIIISTSGDKNFDNSIIPGKLYETSVEGEKTMQTTGNKLIGDKAKGSVTIQNGTDKNLNLSAGAIIRSSGDLAFTLDSSASVSAALSPSSPGTTTVSVTANAIGAEYNLAKGEVFKVGNYSKSDVDATSASDFSGGSSREILAVSKEDQTKLLDDLTTELTESAKGKLSSQISGGETFTGDLVESSEADKKYSAKVGDEASNLKLTLGVTAKGIGVEKSMLLDYAKGVLKGNIPNGFVLRDDQINYKFEFIEEDKDGYKFRVTFSANFLPIVKTEDYVKQISGKSPSVVQNYLTIIPGFSRAEITITPRFPGGLRVLPKVKNNLKIEILAEN